MGSIVDKIDVYFLKGNKLSKSKREKVRIVVFKYLLGLEPYGKTVKKLNRLQKLLGRRMPDFLKSFNDCQIKYTICYFRAYSKTLTGFGRRWFRRKLKVIVLKKDRAYLRKYKTKINYKKVKRFHFFPKYEDIVLKTLKPFMEKQAFIAYLNARKDRARELCDIASDINLRALMAYRQYIFSYNREKFNEKVLGQCIIKSVRTRLLDFYTSLNSKKNLPMVNIVPYKKLENVEEIQEQTMKSVEDFCYDGVESFYVNSFMKGFNSG